MALAPYTDSSNAAAMRVNLSTQARHLARMTRSPARAAMLRRMSAMKAASPVRSLEADDEDDDEDEDVSDEEPPPPPDEWCTRFAYAGFCCWKYTSPSVMGAASILLLIFILPLCRSQSRSHHSGWCSNVGFVTPAMKPGTLSRSSILVRSVYGNACRVKPRRMPPDASAQAARTASATSLDGMLCPRKMMRFCVRRALTSTMMGCVVGPLVVRCGCRGKVCGDFASESEKFWISLIKEKSPTISGMTATGTLTGMGMPL